MSIQAMKQALDVLKVHEIQRTYGMNPSDEFMQETAEAITALRTAIEAEEKVEPVTCKECGNLTMHSGDVCYGCAQKVEPVYMLRELEEHNGGRFVEHYVPDVFNLGTPLYTHPQPAIPAGEKP